MAAEDLMQQIKALPDEEKRLLADHLLDHLTEEDDHDPRLYNLDIF